MSGVALTNGEAEATVALKGRRRAWRISGRGPAPVIAPGALWTRAGAPFIRLECWTGDSGLEVFAGNL